MRQFCVRLASGLLGTLLLYAASHVVAQDLLPPPSVEHLEKTEKTEKPVAASAPAAEAPQDLPLPPKVEDPPPSPAPTENTSEKLPDLLPPPSDASPSDAQPAPAETLPTSESKPQAPDAQAPENKSPVEQSVFVEPKTSPDEPKEAMPAPAPDANSLEETPAAAPPDAISAPLPAATQPMDDKNSADLQPILPPAIPTTPEKTPTRQLKPGDEAAPIPSTPEADSESPPQLPDAAPTNAALPDAGLSGAGPMGPPAPAQEAPPEAHWVPAGVAAVSNESRLASPKSWLTQLLNGGDSQHSALNAHPFSQGTCPDGCDKKHWIVYGMVDWLYWRATMDQNPFATVVTPLVNGQDIQAFTSDYDFNSGVRLTFGARNDQGWDLFLQYTNFSDAGAATVGQQLNDLDFVRFTNASTPPSAGDFASQNQSLRLSVYDLCLGKTANPSGNWEFIPFAGFRYASFKHTDDILYADLEQGSLDRYAVSRTLDVNAYGLRGGFLYDFVIARTGLSIFGFVAGSILYADQTANRSDIIVAPIAGVQSATTFASGANSAVPVLEVRVGARYTFQHFFLGAGYDFSQWYNLNYRIDNPGSSSTSHADVSFSGFFLQGGINY